MIPGKEGFSSKYSVKFLTLTCPGEEYRKTHTPYEAYEEMSYCFDKLERAMKRKYGNFYFIKVPEAQRDGFPHFHALFLKALWSL